MVADGASRHRQRRVTVSIQQRVALGLWSGPLLWDSRCPVPLGSLSVAASELVSRRTLPRARRPVRSVSVTVKLDAQAEPPRRPAGPSPPPSAGTARHGVGAAMLRSDGCPRSAGLGCRGVAG